MILVIKHKKGFISACILLIFGILTSTNTIAQEKISDIDGNEYKTVIIGNQTWMAENLRVTKFNDGEKIPFAKSGGKWEKLSSPAYACYAYNEDIIPLMGCLYNMFTVETEKLCPVEWHVPSEAEWNELVDFLGGTEIAGGKLKSTDLRYWESPNDGATDETNFSALGGGLINTKGLSQYLKKYGSWWSSTGFSDTEGISFNLFYQNKNALLTHSSKNTGFSVRCVKD